MSLLLFFAGSCASASLIGGLLGAVGALIGIGTGAAGPWLWVILGTTAVVYGLAQLVGAHWPVPSRHWQVPGTWDLWGKPKFASAFGGVMGAGVLTVVNFIGLYLVKACCILLASPWIGAGCMAVFGTARAVPVVFPPAYNWLRHRPFSSETAATVNEWLGSRYRVLLWCRAAGLLAFAGVAIAYGVGGLWPVDARTLARVIFAASVVPPIWRRTIITVRVDGESMMPTFVHGDHLLALRLPCRPRCGPFRSLVCRLLVRPGAVVLARPPARLHRLVVKRVDKVGNTIGRASSPSLAGRLVWLKGDGARDRDGGPAGSMPLPGFAREPCPITCIDARVLVHLPAR